MTTSQELLLSSITNFYNKSSDKRNLLDKIIQSEYKISLRVIDWFITHYTRQKNIVIWIDNSNNGEIIENPIHFHANLKKFHIYLEYRTQLKSYTKMFFDPFRRHDRISFVISKRPLRAAETTIGQLNFFRWIFQNNILQYIEKYQEQIEEEMTKFQSIKKGISSKKTIVLSETNDEKTSEKEKTAKQHIRKNIQDTSINSSCFLRFD